MQKEKKTLQFSYKHAVESPKQLTQSASSINQCCIFKKQQQKKGKNLQYLKENLRDATYSYWFQEDAKFFCGNSDNKN